MHSTEMQERSKQEKGLQLVNSTNPDYFMFTRLSQVEKWNWQIVQG